MRTTMHWRTERGCYFHGHPFRRRSRLSERGRRSAQSSGEAALPGEVELGSVPTYPLIFLATPSHTAAVSLKYE
jgi:hypothetical protein